MDKNSFITLPTGANLIKHFTSVTYDFRNKIECLFLAGLSRLVGKARSQPSSVSLEREFTRVVPALQTNNRLGWTGYLGTNTLAYYEN
jgi:hypothetical protein